MSIFDEKLDELKYLVTYGAKLKSRNLARGKYVVLLDGGEEYEFNQEYKEKVDEVLRNAGQIN